MNETGTDDFEFDLVGPLNAKPFLGYASAPDKTAVSPQLMIRGSKNVYKKLSGTIAARTGLKLRGAVDTTLAGVDSSFEWNTSLGTVIPVRVSNSKLQIESSILDGVNPIWYTILSGLTKTRWVFDSWWDNTAKKDVLLAVYGTADMLSWGGGMTILSFGTSNAIQMLGNNALLTSFSITDTSSVVASDGTGSGTATQGAIALSGNPSNGQTVVLTLNTTAITITFTTALVNPGDVLIGPTATLTRDNLLGLLQNPATTNGTQVALSGANQVLVAYLTYGNTKALVKTGTTSWAQAGFQTNTNTSVTINGNTYAYPTTNNGIATTILFYSSMTDPSAEPANSVIFAIVVTNASNPAAGFLADFLKVIDNHVWVGSYSSRLVYVSKSSSYLDFAQSTPRIPGDGELITMDQTGNGITVHGGNALLSAGTSIWYEISFNQITVGSTLSEQTKVTPIRSSGLQGALGHEFMDTMGNDVVYLDQNHQLRMYGDFSQLFTTKFTLLSLPIYDELKDEVFTGGHLRIVDKIVYITAPLAGRDYMYEARESVDPQGNLIAERIWHAPQIRNVSRVAVISGVTYGHSNSNPQLYQMWDTGQWHDDSPFAPTTGVPYTCVMRLAYDQKGRRQGKITFDKLYVEGYLTQGTKLYGNIYFDYQGATGLPNLDLNSAGTIPTYLGTGAPSLGDSPLGDSPLGDGLTIEANDQEMLPKFRIMKGVGLTDCFEYSQEIYTQDLDSRWEVLCIGTNATLADVNAVEIVR